MACLILYDFIVYDISLYIVMLCTASCISTIALIDFRGPIVLYVCRLCYSCIVQLLRQCYVQYMHVHVPNTKYGYTYRIQ